MSYLRAKKTDQEDPVTVEHGFHLPEIDFEDRPTLDSELDADGVLSFVLGLINQVNELSEGEALVVWKEIF